MTLTKRIGAGLLIALVALFMWTTVAKSGKYLPLLPGDEVNPPGSLTLLCSTEPAMLDLLDRFEEHKKRFINTGVMPDGCVSLPLGTIVVEGPEVVSEFRYLDDAGNTTIVISIPVDEERSIWSFRRPSVDGTDA